MKTYIQNGYVIDPASAVEGQMDILIADGKIEKMGKNLLTSQLKAEIEDGLVQVIDAKGLVVAPGLVDVHSHFRDPGFTYKEDIESGSKAAAKGGYTSIVLMANTKPTVDSVETLQYVLEKGKRTDIHIHTCCSVTMGLKGLEMTDMDALKAAGAVGFTDDGVPLLDEDLVKRAMKKVAALNVPISFHEENPAFIENNGVNRGKASQFYGIGGSDRQAEIDLVGRDLQLALETGAHLDIQHISTKEAVELVRQAKKKGSNIHAEACPHHFALNEEAVIAHGTLAKMNPPLREEADRLAIVEGLKDGTIDLIATDHAPHSAEEKAKPITEAPSGIIGLETALPLAVTYLVKSKEMDLRNMLEKLTINPARLYHLDAGYLAENGPADMVIFDADGTYVAGDYVSKSTNTPFTGMELKGLVRYTICNGQVVYKRG